MSSSYEDDHHASTSDHGSTSIWRRGLSMLLLMCAFWLGQSVLFAVAVVQFLWMLIKRERNMFLADFGHSLALWLAETAWFLSADTEEKPFPWKAWPKM